MRSYLNEKLQQNYNEQLNKGFDKQIGNNMVTNWLSQTVRRANIVRRKAVGRSIFAVFSNGDKYPLEITGDVIPGVAVDQVGMHVHVKLDLVTWG